MIKSMTAYAYATLTEKELSVIIEIRTYNSRHLDIALRLPPAYLVLEDKIKRASAAEIARGRVELRMHIKELSATGVQYTVDMAKAQAYWEALACLKEGLRLTAPIGLEHFNKLDGIIQPIEDNPPVENYWPLIEACLRQALADLDKMRLREGDFLKNDFKQRLTFITQSLEKISQGSQNLLALYRDKLQARIETLTKGLIELDQLRITQEAAILADRSDISEEIVRTRSHIKQFNAIIDADGPAGRKLNFLLQELNREFNTMGAKVGQADLAHTIVDVKAEFEKLREQVQNIE